MLCILSCTCEHSWGCNIMYSLRNHFFKVSCSPYFVWWILLLFGPYTSMWRTLIASVIMLKIQIRLHELTWRRSQIRIYELNTFAGKAELSKLNWGELRRQDLETLIVVHAHYLSLHLWILAHLQLLYVSCHRRPFWFYHFVPGDQCTMKRVTRREPLRVKIRHLMSDLGSNRWVWIWAYFTQILDCLLSSTQVHVENFRYMQTIFVLVLL